MRSLFARGRYAVLATILAAPVSHALAGALSIGSFNLTRGGVESLDNADAAMLRAAITQAFPGTKFHYVKALSAHSLAKIKVLVIGVALTTQQEITPLSTKEQAALLAFVKAGGTALLFCDNSTDFQNASTSFVAPFGLASTGELSGDQTANFLNLQNDPIQTGPFGTATQFDTGYPGWLPSVGNAIEVAALTANNEPEIAYFPAGSLGSGSGAAVFFGDSDALIDSLRTQNDQIVILNSLALAP